MKAYGTVQGFALHSSTFSGGSLACAAGLAALRALQEEGLVENAQARGRQLAEGLAELRWRCPLVRDIRGRGLMLGLEFNPLPRTMVKHFKGMDASGPAAFQVANLDELIQSIPPSRSWCRSISPSPPEWLRRRRVVRTLRFASRLTRQWSASF
jgi:acetylornithine/succinyldiaminopimelate/putrescine aminotransferase